MRKLRLRVHGDGRWGTAITTNWLASEIAVNERKHGRSCPHGWFPPWFWMRSTSEFHRRTNPGGGRLWQADAVLRMSRRSRGGPEHCSRWVHDVLGAIALTLPGFRCCVKDTQGFAQNGIGERGARRSQRRRRDAWTGVDPNYTAERCLRSRLRLLQLHAERAGQALR